MVVRANISRVFGVWGKCTRTTTKSIHYAIQQLAEPVVRLEYQVRLAQSVADLPLKGKPAQEQWQNIADEFTLLQNLQLGLSLQPNSHKHQFCPDLAQISAKQRHLRLRINNTTDDQQRQQLKRQHNSVLHAMRRKALANASVILDERAAEAKRLHDRARMFRAVHLLCRRPHLQAVEHDEHGHTIEDPVEVGRQSLSTLVNSSKMMWQLDFQHSRVTVYHYNNQLKQVK